MVETRSRHASTAAASARQHAPHALSAAAAPATRGARSVTATDLEVALHDRGLKRSAPRTAILAALAACTSHVSAEELTSLVRQHAAGVSLSTVYRTLKVLVGAGLATARAFGDGHTRFELAHPEHHDHLVCTACGVVVEFRDDEIERRQTALARAHGFELATHKLELYGRCEGCRGAHRPGSAS
jgi:Fur family transcriptional regulator, ferric uptake regulator